MTGLAALRTRCSAAVLVAALALPVVPGAASAEEWVAGYTLGITRTRFGGALADSIPRGQYGFGFGVFVSYPILPQVQLRPEILITTKGGTFHEPLYLYDYIRDTTYYAGDLRRTLDLTYIEVPLILSASLLRPAAAFNPHLQAGFAPALRILGRFRSGTYSGSEPADPDDARRFDVSWIAGAGFRLRNRRANLRLDLRYSQGLTDVFDRGAAPPGRNQVWSLVFGITP